MKEASAPYTLLDKSDFNPSPPSYEVSQGSTASYASYGVIDAHTQVQVENLKKEVAKLKNERKKLKEKVRTSETHCYFTTNHSRCRSFAWVLIIIAGIISASIWWGSYKPLQAKLERMENMGPTYCNLSKIFCVSKVLDINDTSTYQLYSKPYNTIYAQWHHELNVRGSKKVEPVIIISTNNDPHYFDCTRSNSVIEDLYEHWINFHDCWIDIEELDDVFLDLDDIRASVATTGARFSFSVFFFVIFLIGIMILIIIRLLKYKRDCDCPF